MNAEHWKHLQGHIRGAPLGVEGYVHHHCRCTKCRESYRALGKTARERRLKAPNPEHVHGTWNGYSNYGCRCARCLEACRAKYDYARAWRLKRKKNK